MGEEVEEEKDFRLERFAEMGESIRNALAESGYWSDYIDPCSGLPMHGDNNNNVYSECDGYECDRYIQGCTRLPSILQ